jgi:hypothetical protein
MTPQAQVALDQYDDKVNTPAITQFSNRIRFPVNVEQHPNAPVIDIYISGFEDKPRPTLEQVRNLSKATFGKGADLCRPL